MCVLFICLIVASVSPDVRDPNFGSMDRAFEGFTFVDESAAQHMTTNKGGTASYKGLVLTADGTRLYTVNY